jgi:hypothetical protein
LDCFIFNFFFRFGFSFVTSFLGLDLLPGEEALYKVSKAQFEYGGALNLKGTLWVTNYRLWFRAQDVCFFWAGRLKWEKGEKTN